MPRVPEEWSGKLLVVGEGSETKQAKKLLRRTWRVAGYSDSDIAFVPAVRCGGGGEPSMDVIRACRPFLNQVIYKLKPKNILGIGAAAMRALRNVGEENITRNRGKEIRIPGL